MIEINLAPGVDKRRKPSRSSVRMPSLPAVRGDVRTTGLGALALLLLLSLGFVFWRQGARKAELSAQIALEQADSTGFSTTIALVNALRARQDTIQQKIGVIREVDQRRYVWPHLLDEIAAAVPQFTWLTDLASGEPADSTVAGPTVTLQGNAGSTQALTRFMKNLEASPFVREVTLVTSEQQDVEGRTLHRFTLEARYEVPDEATIETVPIVVVN